MKKSLMLLFGFGMGLSMAHSAPFSSEEARRVFDESSVNVSTSAKVVGDYLFTEVSWKEDKSGAPEDREAQELSALLAASFTFTATATGVEKGAAVEFVFAGPNTDRDYETMFVIDGSVDEFCAKLEKAGESDIDRKVLTFIKAKGSDRTYWCDGQKYWRVSVFIPDTVTKEEVNRAVDEALERIHIKHLKDKKNYKMCIRIIAFN